MIQRIKAWVWDCACENCKHGWLSLAHQPPASCPNCKSRAWNGKKKIGRPVRAKNTANATLPKPIRTRPIE